MEEIWFLSSANEVRQLKFSLKILMAHAYLVSCFVSDFYFEFLLILSLSFLYYDNWTCALKLILTVGPFHDFLYVLNSIYNAVLRFKLPVSVKILQNNHSGWGKNDTECTDLRGAAGGCTAGWGRGMWRRSGGALAVGCSMWGVLGVGYKNLQCKVDNFLTVQVDIVDNIFVKHLFK